MTIPTLGSRVRVNLCNEGTRWFIRDIADYNCRCAAETVVLGDVSFVFDTDKRAEQLKTGRSNTHAIAVGILMSFDDPGFVVPLDVERVRYVLEQAPPAFRVPDGRIVTSISKAWGDKNCRLWGRGLVTY